MKSNVLKKRALFILSIGLLFLLNDFFGGLVSSTFKTIIYIVLTLTVSVSIFYILFKDLKTSRQQTLGKEEREIEKQKVFQKIGEKVLEKKKG